MSGNRQDCVLIFRLGSIGDTVVALPCFHGIARTFSNHRRVLLTNAVTSSRTSSAESILDGTGLVDEVIYYPGGDFGVRPMMRLAREIRRLRPAAMIYLVDRPTAAPVYRDIAFFKAVGVPRIVGIPWNWQLRNCKVDPDSLELEHEAQRLARTLQKAVPVNLSHSNWDLRLSASELAKADALVGSIETSDSLLAIAPGTKVAAKDWGIDNWTSLLNSLASRYARLGLVLVGARDERELCDGIAGQWTGPVLNLCGLLTPRETAAALRRCKLLVCLDSGPMHIAASQQIRCVALFGNYNRPRRWYPFGGGHVVIYEPRGVRAISVQRVVKEIQGAIDCEAAPQVAEKAVG
ncbi:MAG: glycosyltransferase family 9 protein [Steroidobacteraceae bacterium]